MFMLNVMKLWKELQVTNGINVTMFKNHVSGLISCNICLECKCKTTYSSTMHEIIVNIRSNIHLAIKEFLRKQD